MALPVPLSTPLLSSDKRSAACGLGLSSGWEGLMLFVLSEKGIQTNHLCPTPMNTGLWNLKKECKSYESGHEQIKWSRTLTCGGQEEIQSPFCERHRHFLLEQHQTGSLSNCRSSKSFPSAQLSVLTPKLKASWLLPFRSHGVCSFKHTAAQSEQKAPWILSLQCSEKFTG